MIKHISIVTFAVLMTLYCNLSLASASWMSSGNAWCLILEASKTCLPEGYSPIESGVEKIIFASDINSSSPPIILTAYSDRYAAAEEDDLAMEILYSTEEFGIRTTVRKGLGMYVSEFTLAPDANLRLAGNSLDQVESLSKILISSWSKGSSPDREQIARCEKFFHARCTKQ